MLTKTNNLSGLHEKLLVEIALFYCAQKRIANPEPCRSGLQVPTSGGNKIILELR